MSQTEKPRPLGRGDVTTLSEAEVEQMSRWLVDLLAPHFGRVGIAVFSPERIQAHDIATVDIPIQAVARQLLMLQRNNGSKGEKS